MAAPSAVTVKDMGAFPLTIPDWLAAQSSGDGLALLIALLDSIKGANSNAWISLSSPSQLATQWDQVSCLRASGQSLPLFGVPFAAKDNMDVAGMPTTAACPAYALARGSVLEDAPVIARLKAAGAILIGKTNLDQFATGLVGTRSWFGPVGNAFDPSYVSGGSSSGSAVVVSKGMVPFALGTDTAGSGRVPAGLNNVVGLKPTRGAISARAVVPACRTLDCVSILALTIEDAETVLKAAEGFDVEDAYSRQRSLLSADDQYAAHADKPRTAICKDPDWFGRDHQAEAYETALSKVRGLGWDLEAVDFSDLFKLAHLLYEGPWVAERYSAIREFFAKSSHDMDPVVRSILKKAETFSAVDVFESEYLRQELTRKIEVQFAEYDVILVPTTPTFPTLQDLVKEPVLENSILGTYTNFVNFLDWSALSIPAGFRADGLPFGLTLISTKWQEPKLFTLGRRILSASDRRLGTTSIQYRESLPAAPNAYGSEKRISVAVVGAHLKGFPLNKDLTSRGATFVTATKTAPKYRLYALASKSSTVKKPGLKRVEGSAPGHAIELEIWSLPESQFAGFVQTIPSPLGIGSIELKTSDWVLGFVCEPYGLENAVDISAHGGWRGYTASAALSPTNNLLQDTPPLTPAAPLTPEIESTEVPLAINTNMKAIKRVLIANRGEIAVRIIKTLRKMDIESIAIYSTADAVAEHTKTATSALPLTGNSVSETYLNGKQILDLAAQASADAVIPGYGFLAENADFAEAVEAAGLVWIGPTPTQMRDLGMKHRAREIARGAGVPVVPGSDLISNVDDTVAEARRIGYPIMVKSTAGGGGIGLRMCGEEKLLVEAFDAVQRLAQSNFGDSGVFLERYIEHARHIEVQILGDGQGNVVAVGERDCSLQRRNQKVVEECPAVFVLEEVRQRMRKAAIAVASAVKYRNVGTVEFIFDIKKGDFFFLEVNTRLQVEHPVTEEVSGLDLVRAMVEIACGNFNFPEPQIRGFSVEARVYAESPLQGFRPSPGKLIDVVFPSDIRVDTWVQSGTEMSSSYDPLIAKIIAVADTRDDAIQKLLKALQSTIITGVETNIEYVAQIISSELFTSGNFDTKSLDHFTVQTRVVEIIDAGASTSIQDYPGRVGFWNVGIPPSGPMDDYSFRLANRLVDNPENAAGLECTAQGPSLLFHSDVVVAVVGASVDIQIDGTPAETHRLLDIKAGQKLSIGLVKTGYRCYIAIQGGISVPTVFGSRSTFPLGQLGGHNGRVLRSGDLLRLSPMEEISELSTLQLEAAIVPAIPIPDPRDPVWRVAVIPGPHGCPDLFTAASFSELFSSEWTVHYNSNRLGVRLTGPKPEWARATGNEAGLHPSNIHDSPYPIGGVSFTGDEAVVLTCDGPSLGGFVVFATVISAELWKFGQMRPGDRIMLVPVTAEHALSMSSALQESIVNLSPLAETLGTDAAGVTSIKPISPELSSIGSETSRIISRQAGDRSVLLEFGCYDGFDLRQTIQIADFIARHKATPIPGVEELSPGVRTLHVKYGPGILPSEILASLGAHGRIAGSELPRRFPSRKVRLPFVFDDKVSQAAVARYAATIRASAPYLPSNVEFLRKLNFPDGEGDVETVLHSATFIVLGLGDVFLGSPCAVPLDPRHRLFGTKYNPPRSFTPRGSVGIGGQYLCIYATESPGGYQLVGRTVPIWADDKIPRSTRTTKDPMPNAWMFQILDQISFYPINEEELDAAITSGKTDELVLREESTLDVDAYEGWLNDNRSDIEAVAKQRSEAMRNVKGYNELLQTYERAAAPASSAPDAEMNTMTGERIKAQIPGRCFKCEVVEGSDVDIGSSLIWIESNKMEIEIASPIKGVCTKVLVKVGDIVGPFDDVAIIAPSAPTFANMSYAAVAGSGPKQTPQEAAAPQPPSIVPSESASTSSLVDVDTPSVRTVPSDFLEQDVQTDTQASRLEREEEVFRAEADLAKKKVTGKARKADNVLTKWFRNLTEGESQGLVAVNAAAILGVSGWLTYKAIGLYDRGRLGWKNIGIGLGILAGVSIVPGFVGGYLYKSKKQQS